MSQFSNLKPTFVLLYTPLKCLSGKEREKNKGENGWRTTYREPLEYKSNFPLVIQTNRAVATCIMIILLSLTSSCFGVDLKIIHFP